MTTKRTTVVGTDIEVMETPLPRTHFSPSTRTATEDLRQAVRDMLEVNPYTTSLGFVEDGYKVSINIIRGKHFKSGDDHPGY